MANPRPLILTDAGFAAGAPEPVSIEGIGSAAGGDVADFVAIDSTPADATAVATDLIALRTALIAAGLMAAS